MSIRRKHKLKNIDWILPYRSVFTMWLHISFIWGGALALAIGSMSFYMPLALWPVTGDLVWSFDVGKIFSDIIFGIILGFYVGSLLVLYRWWIHR